jgi:MYXO-CTERM domain-containing protein
MRSRLARVCGYGLGVLTLIVATQRHLLATIPATAPEIDGASISAGLGLIAACVLILRSRRRSK